MILLLLSLLLSSCAFNTLSTDISLNDVKLIEVYAHSAAAYYLSREGTLYCTGADTDAASFVVYEDAKNGIVAQNVKLFEELVGGGCYIDNNDDLYLWNESQISLLGYGSPNKHTKILSGIKFVSAYSKCLIYIDMDSNLYLVGSFLGEDFSVDNPKLLDKNVSCADIYDERIVWARNDGEIDGYGKIDSAAFNKLNAVLSEASFLDISVAKDFIVVLCNNELWFFGDYQMLVTGEKTESNQLIQLGKNITKVSCSRRTIAALNDNGNMLLWGRCVSNSAQDTRSPCFEYCEKLCLAEKALNVFVSDSCICYIDENGYSCIYYASGWPLLYGNSTDDSCVGIKREPTKWIS